MVHAASTAQPFLDGLAFPEALRDALARRMPGPGPAIKICGLSTPDSLGAALDAGADLVGFVFFAKSPRHVSLTEAHALAALAGTRAVKVALSVDADDDMLDAIVAHASPDMLQLHGRETPERVSVIRARFGLPVMKAIGVSGAADLAGAHAYLHAADRLLFDAKPPADATLPGGNGLAFDWALLHGLAWPAPYMLSGGLDAQNVVEAAARTGAAAVDVSSGVESAPGHKDPARISTFIRTLRNAASSGALSGIETLGSEARTV